MKRYILLSLLVSFTWLSLFILVLKSLYDADSYIVQRNSDYEFRLNTMIDYLLEERPQGRDTEEILNTVNNVKTIDELITKEYSKTVLSYRNRIFLDIHKVDEIAPIECLRKVDDYTYYTVDKSVERGYKFCLLTKKEKDDSFYISDTWYFEKPLYRRNFETLPSSVKNWDDILEIDPYGNNISFDFDNYDLPLRSIHQTVDGYIVTITYSKPIINLGAKQKYKIKDIEITPRSENKYVVSSKLLQVDLDFIKQMTGM